jgi:3-oxoacyl-[acyl-carrier protein] reductase
MNYALVTGASRGLGKAIALQLSKDLGLHIIINYSSNQTAAEDTLSQIKEAGGSGELMQFNVQDKETVDNALNKWAKDNPTEFISVLVNNAGITKDGLFVFMSEKDWDSVMEVSSKGMFNVTRNLIEKMVRKRNGRIINIASLSGLKGVPGQTNYSAAKGAMIASTKALAQEVAKRKITVNAVAPGFIESDMTNDLPVDQLKQMIPMNRFGKADEVAHMVSFLASEKSSYITGEVININGGIYS